MSERKGQMIEYPANGGTVPAYLSRPEGEGPFPAVIAIQEWWGLVGHIKDVADRFAAAGFLTLAPDLYHGQAASEPDEARKLAMALDRQRAVEEISAAGRYLAGLDEVSTKQVGVVGWCMGGGLSLSTAAHNNVIGAAVAFYGRPLEAADTATLHVPVLGLYGELDHGIPVSLVNDFDKELEAAGVTHEIHVYSGAHHAFFNEGRPEAYNADASADAWQRTLAWFRQHLT